ncbi:uncharacterized [Tachysurus ichikawai]
MKSLTTTKRQLSRAVWYTVCYAGSQPFDWKYITHLAPVYHRSLLHHSIYHQISNLTESLLQHPIRNPCHSEGSEGAGLYCGTGLNLGRTSQRSLNGASCLNNRDEGARLVQVTEIGSGVETGQRDRTQLSSTVFTSGDSPHLWRDHTVKHLSSLARADKGK